MKKYISITFGVLVFLIFMFSFIFSKMSEYDESACSGITKIANSVEKINYLESWAEGKLKDKKFLGLMGWKGEIRLADRPELIDVVDIDWRFLGFNEGEVFVKFNRFMVDRDNYLDASTIKSLSFGQGRRLMIFVSLVSSRELGLDWSGESLRKITKVNDKVSVFCGN